MNYIYSALLLHSAKKEINEELDEMLREDHQISTRVEKDELNLNLEDMLTFFSSWEYSVIYLAPSLENEKITINSLSIKYGINISRFK